VNPDEGQPQVVMLTTGERANVIAVAGGFVFVLAFLVYLSWRFDYFPRFIEQIEEALRGGKIRELRLFILLLLAYGVGLPVGVSVAVIALVQGLRGRSTRLTRWILRESTHAGAMERQARQVDEARRQGTISAREQKVLKIALPPAIGWAIFILFLIAMAVVLIVVINRDG
jgi:hypothetical protein